MNPWQGGFAAKQAKSISDKASGDAAKAFGEAWAAAFPDLANKGKGKSNGKETPSKLMTTALKPGQWLCRWKECRCRWAWEAKPNHAFRKSCGCCHTQ